jgi:hypothetical protein
MASDPRLSDRLPWCRDGAPRIRHPGVEDAPYSGQFDAGPMHTQAVTWRLTAVSAPDRRVRRCLSQFYAKTLVTLAIALTRDGQTSDS